jgi:hypothetical protein
MKNLDPLVRFEEMTARLQEDPPPRVHVVPQVLRRIRAVRETSERTLEFLAAGSCVAAILAVLVGFSMLSQLSDPLEAIFQIVPPIGL